MKPRSPIGYHLLFWLAYFSVNLFNELYLSSSFTAHPSTELLFDSLVSQLLVLALKIPAVYYVLYSLIPRWGRGGNKTRLLLETGAFLLLTVVLYRALVQLVIWPYIYHNEAITLTLPQQLARCFYSLLDLLQVIGIAAAIKLFRMRLAALEHEKALAQETLRAEMLHLKSQLNPHFLFNALNSIYVLSRSHAPETPDVVMRLSKLLRYTLYESARKTIPLETELQLLHDFLELQQLRFGNRKVVQLEKQLDDPQAPIAPLLILPLLENAFKHGDLADPVQCRIVLRQGVLAVNVENLIGQASVSEGEGIGLVNLRRQLELLYRDYSFMYGVEDGRFVVDLHITLSSYAGAELFDH